MKKVDRMQQFFEMRKDQEKVMEKYVEDMRKVMFRGKGYPKELDGALLFSEALYEREKQKEFSGIIRQKQIEQEKEHANKVKRDAEEEKKEKAELEEKLQRKKKEYREMVTKQ